MSKLRANTITCLKQLGFKPREARGGVFLSTNDAAHIVSILKRLEFAAQALTANCHRDKV